MLAQHTFSRHCGVKKCAQSREMQPQKFKDYQWASQTLQLSAQWGIECYSEWCTWLCALKNLGLATFEPVKNTSNFFLPFFFPPACDQQNPETGMHCVRAATTDNCIFFLPVPNWVSSISCYCWCFLFSLPPPHILIPVSCFSLQHTQNEPM